MYNKNKKTLLYLPDASSGETRVMYFGNLAVDVLQRTVVTTLLLSLNDDVELVDLRENRSYIGRSFLIPGGREVLWKGDNAISAHCFLDIYTRDLHVLKPRMQERFQINNGLDCYRGMPNEDLLLEWANHVYEEQVPARQAFKSLAKWVKPVKDAEPILIDPRIKMAITYIRNNYDKNISISEMAGEIGLSEPRLIQLFKQVTGVPLRRFRLMYRIYMTTQNLARGLRLTDAAVEAGFADYSHFSRTFKHLSGMKPSDALTAHSNLHILRHSDQAERLPVIAH